MGRLDLAQEATSGFSFLSKFSNLFINPKLFQIEIKFEIRTILIAT
jgi:hypothetical protein